MTQRSPLHLAIEGGHIEVSRVLIEHGSDIAYRDRLHYTPLDYAVLYGHVKIVELLVAKGANENRMNKSSLHLAAEANQLKVIEVLLAHGFNPDSHDKFGYTLLHRAAKYKKPKLEVVEVLVRNGANVMAVDRDGYTPLHLAAKEGNSEILTFLLKHDADPLVFSKAWFAWNKKNPLHLALEGNRQECVELIKQHIIGESFEKFLIVHRKNFGQDLMDLLFSPGTNVNVLNSNGDSPLHVAARFGDLEVVETLKSLFADCKTKNNDGETPLDIARARLNECERVVRFLEETSLVEEKSAASSLMSRLTTGWYIVSSNIRMIRYFGATMLQITVGSTTCFTA